ncbi:MAG: DNA repair exonuclease [Firmicutes bacterium]|nr:DNA repair exonuclease [Bacillota bacterium]
MKILHCADIHLDSPMSSLQDPEKSRERRLELVTAFQKMAEFGAMQGVSAVIIAGDLFDVSRIPASTRNSVLSTIRRHGGIKWFYLKGNHDKNDFLNGVESVPDNLFMFRDSWQSYRLGERICVSGAELNKDNAGTLWTSLQLDPGDFNIVVLHGQEVPSAGRQKAELIDLKALRGRGIDYLALGHVHSFKCEQLDGRAVYCYPGCLEARGFDETGTHGFVILDIDESTGLCTREFFSTPIRSAYEVNVDVTGLGDSSAIISAVLAKIREAGCRTDDMLEIVVSGELGLDDAGDLQLIRLQLEDRFYAFRLKDATRLKVDFDKYRGDRSLKGEFIRAVEARADLDDDMKARVIRCGIRALMGEEVGL